MVLLNLRYGGTRTFLFYTEKTEDLKLTNYFSSLDPSLTFGIPQNPDNSEVPPKSPKIAQSPLQSNKLAEEEAILDGKDEGLEILGCKMPQNNDSQTKEPQKESQKPNLASLTPTKVFSRRKFSLHQKMYLSNTMNSQFKPRSDLPPQQHKIQPVNHDSASDSMGAKYFMNLSKGSAFMKNSEYFESTKEESDGLKIANPAEFGATREKKNLKKPILGQFRACTGSDDQQNPQSPNLGRNFGSASKSEAFFSPASHLGSVKSCAENQRDYYLQELSHCVGPKAETQEEGNRKEIEVLFPNGDTQIVNRPKDVEYQNDETNRPIRANKGALSRIQSHLSDNQKLARRRSPRVSPQKPQPQTHIDPSGISLNIPLCPFYFFVLLSYSSFPCICLHNDKVSYMIEISSEFE